MSLGQKAVVLGGRGMTGSKIVKRLEDRGWEVVAASRRSGVDLITGEGLPEAMSGASVVIDATNVPAYDEDTLMTFFAKASKHIVRAAKDAGVGHHLVLSIVGIDTVPNIAYAQGKIAQERAVAESGIPYTIFRATQFYEWLGVMANDFTEGDVAAVPDAHLQPVAIDDVVSAIVDIALAPPRNGIVEVAGPEENTFESWIQRFFEFTGDKRKARTSREASYFGGKLEKLSMIPGRDAVIGAQSFAQWASSAAGKAVLAARAD